MKLKVKNIRNACPRPEAIFSWEEGAQRRWLVFSRPVETLQAFRPDEIPGLLELAEDHARQGGWAAGFLSYEASPAFDPSFRVRPPSPLPLAWFGLYPQAGEIASPFDLPAGPFHLGKWIPSLKRREYEDKIKRIKRLIADGDTYQVNYTFRLRASFQGDPLGLWLRLVAAQPRGRPAFFDTGRFAILSASPELFFYRDRNGGIVCRPMKGTARRGLTAAGDREEMEKLAASGKNRAENLMIVDMIRNDLGKIAFPGMVKTQKLFSVEKHPTLLQMTSTVTAVSPSSLKDVMAALFPCASVTGAPKIRAMEIIAETEKDPRGVYTGTVGVVAPGGESRFNVAIRTATVDNELGEAVYGTGGGIVWDSRPRSEYSEALLKSSILFSKPVEFELLETLRWEKGKGYFLLEEHISRLVESAQYFDFPVDPARIRRKLNRYALSFRSSLLMVRLKLDRQGKIHLEHNTLSPKEKPWKLALAEKPVDPRDPFLYHKTTHREVYEQARAGRPDCDDVILFNSRGQVTETTRANLVVKWEGRYCTPPVKCGLLDGVYRKRLLKEGVITERDITLEELKRCRQVFLVNSVRKWIPAARIKW